MHNHSSNFTHKQTQELEKLFDKFYSLSNSIVLIAKTTKMAIISQDYTDQILEYSEIELAFDHILNHMKFIHGESLELSFTPDYLFWENRNIYKKDENV